jgi:DNA-binding GntR family transcriptional regulator
MIQRQPLRSDVLNAVLEHLLDGRWTSGRINESELATELGISRTPLREALLVLEQRGLLESAMGRGYRVRPLNLQEANELYTLLAVLEPMALRCSVAALRAVAAQLHEVLDQMAAARDSQRLLSLSGQWSALLLAACSNHKLRQILTDLLRLAKRYERANIEALDLSTGEIQASVVAAHRVIVDAIVADRIEEAATALAATWEACHQALRASLPAPTGAQP